MARLPRHGISLMASPIQTPLSGMGVLHAAIGALTCHVEGASIWKPQSNAIWVLNGSWLIRGWFFFTNWALLVGDVNEHTACENPNLYLKTTTR